MLSKSSRRRVVAGGVQGAAECAVTERYEALLRVSRNLTSIRSSEELFRLLARELRAVVKFYVMGVGIYDLHNLVYQADYRIVPAVNRAVRDQLNLDYVLPQKLDTHHKALIVNLDPSTFGSFAE